MTHGPGRCWLVVLAHLVALALLAAPGSATAREHQPLHFEPAPGGHAIAKVILISGDGGWKHIEREFAAGLAADHVDVVGIDSRIVFARHQSAARVAAYIDALSRTKLPIVLIGYSFGADLLPIVWSDLDATAQARIAAVILVAPTHDGSTEVDPTNVYDPLLHPMIPLANQARRLPISRLVCIASEEETESGYSSCRDAPLRGAINLVFAGGHDFDDASHEVVSMVSRLVIDAVGAIAPRIER